MKSKLHMQAHMGYQLERPPSLILPFHPKGVWQLQKLDRNGNVIETIKFNNGIVHAGVQHAYDCVFHAGAQITLWYIGLIDNSGYSALSAADTMASHPGWNEFTTYGEATRVQWDTAATSGRTITSATPADFSINGSGTVRGGFLVSNSEKGGSSGVLWSTGVFANPPTVANGETLKITYSLTG